MLSMLLICLYVYSSAKFYLVKKTVMTVTLGVFVTNVLHGTDVLYVSMMSILNNPRWAER